MDQPAPSVLDELGIEWPPTEDELPYSDGEPMESQRHVLQMYLLIETLSRHWADRPDGFVGGNMFIHFSLQRARNKDFRGPDFFAVLDVPRRERKSWVVWEEGKGPDVVIELLSESTAAVDKGEKKLVYQDQLRVPEYFWFDPFSGAWAGFALREGLYEPLETDAHDRLISQRLGLALVRWSGAFREVDARWLRWATLDGELLPTEHEVAETARQQAEAARQQAETARQQAEAAQRRIAELEKLLAQYQQRDAGEA